MAQSIRAADKRERFWDPNGVESRGVRQAPWLLAILGCFIAVQVFAQSGEWARGMSNETFSLVYIFQPFEIHSVSDFARDGGLRAVCTFTNAKPALTALKGIETADGDFYPAVETLIRDESTGQWHKVEGSSSVTGKATTISVPALSRSPRLSVDMEVFRPCIGKATYGKLLLKTGESIVFHIDELRSPALIPFNQ